MSKDWQVKVLETAPWAGASFTGARVRIELMPPDGMILAEVEVSNDGVLLAIVLDDD
jgi:hypothetical protein